MRRRDTYSSKSARFSTRLPVQGIVLLVAAVAGILAVPATSDAVVITFAPGEYDNTANTITAGPVQHLNQTFGSFRDVFWWTTRQSATGIGSADYINRGNSLVLSGNHAVPGPGPYTALNFTGNAVSEGQTYMSVYDTTPGNVAPKNLFDASGGKLIVSADVLFAHPGHSVSGGVFAMYNEGQDALALLAHQGGGNNPDHARLDLTFQSAGQGIELASVNLPGLTSFVAGEWYRVVMELTVAGDVWNMLGTIQRHVDPTNPNSALVVAPIATLPLVGSLSNPGNALDLTNPGEVGVIAQANQGFSDGIPDPLNPTVDNVGVSITNFDPVIVPEPTSAALAFLGLFGMIRLSRRGRQ